MRRGANTRIPMVMPQGSQAELEAMQGPFHGANAASAPPLMATQTITRGGQTIQEGAPEYAAPSDGSRWVSVSGNRGGPAAERWRALAQMRREFHSTTTAMPSLGDADAILENPGARGPTQPLAGPTSYAGGQARGVAPADGRERPSELAGMWNGSGQPRYDPPDYGMVTQHPDAPGPPGPPEGGPSGAPPTASGGALCGGDFDWRRAAVSAATPSALGPYAGIAYPHLKRAWGGAYAGGAYAGGGHAGGSMAGGAGAGGSECDTVTMPGKKRKRAPAHPDSVAGRRSRLIGGLMRGGGMTLGQAAKHVSSTGLMERIRAGHSPEDILKEHAVSMS